MLDTWIVKNLNTFNLKDSGKENADIDQATTNNPLSIGINDKAKVIIASLPLTKSLAVFRDKAVVATVG